MKIVVTGACGHIGSRMIRSLPDLLPAPHITMVDNLATQRYAALFDLRRDGHYRFVEADIRNQDVEPLFAGADVALHLAAITDATRSIDNAAEVEANNYVGTENVARICAATGTRLIALSSTSVYGTQLERVDEFCGIEQLNPQSPYAEVKLREEQLIAGMCETEGLRAQVCRFGTIIGTSPGMRFHTAVNKFCWQAVMGLPITVWKTAYDQKRPYLGLNDACRAIAHLIENAPFDGNVYNVVSANTTVRQIVEAIRRIVPNAEVSFVDSPIMNQLSYEVANSRLDLEEFVFYDTPEDGIVETIDLLRGANGLAQFHSAA